MHDIEPYYRWRQYYIASDDKLSPFFGREYNEFGYSHKIYNYYIHPQWDHFGSQTLYTKLLWVNYEHGIAIIEMIGEWNDALYNDIMLLKKNVLNQLIDNNIYKFILICDNVLNFHGSDDCYYEDWWDDIKENRGYICFVNTRDHVVDEMESTGLQYYVQLNDDLCDLDWQRKNPPQLIAEVEQIIQSQVQQLDY